MTQVSDYSPYKAAPDLWSGFKKGDGGRVVSFFMVNADPRLNSSSGLPQASQLPTILGGESSTENRRRIVCPAVTAADVLFDSSIHGLWPDFCDGSFPQFCDESREFSNVTAVLQDFNQQALIDYMNVFWVDWNGRSADFWEFEFNKHGTYVGRRLLQKNDLLKFAHG